MMQKYQKWKKYFTASDYNKLTSNILDAKITQKKLLNESGLDEKIRTLSTIPKEEIETLATKVELKAEQNKIVRLQTNDKSLFIGQSYFKNDGSQNHLIFQPIYKTITTFSGLTTTISEWKSKVFSNEKFSPPYTANKSLSPKLVWMNNSRIRLEFPGSCLQQEDKTPFTTNSAVDFIYCL